MATTLTKPKLPAREMSDEQFLAFLEPRPHHERWELIDGEPVMMNPPKLRHQKIGGNLAWELNSHFRGSRPELCALQEIGLHIPGIRRFRPRPDVAVIDDQVDLETSWADRFLLVAEVLSDSNTPRHIERKRQHYLQHPLNLYVLIIAQREVRVEIWSRSSGWRQTILTRLDQELDLADLGLTIPLSRLYSGTKVA